MVLTGLPADKARWQRRWRRGHAARGLVVNGLSGHARPIAPTRSGISVDSVAASRLADARPRPARSSIGTETRRRWRAIDDSL